MADAIERLSGCRTYHVGGKSFAKTTVNAVPAQPMMAIMDEEFFNVSLSVSPTIRPIDQKPLSFIQGNGFGPLPIASGRYTG